MKNGQAALVKPRLAAIKTQRRLNIGEALVVSYAEEASVSIPAVSPRPGSGHRGFRSIEFQAVKNIKAGLAPGLRLQPDLRCEAIQHFHDLA